jgi:2-polyprenyl-3-methyl-5-hydroxy-6-metoxy-1,4-benzoquinol methylase
MPNYGDPKYWDERYKSELESTFDWLEDYETLKSLFLGLNLNKSEVKVLVLGCGNSKLSEEMYDDGFCNIYNIDISDYVINQMSMRNLERKQMKCIQ